MNFSQREEEILSYWNEQEIFHKTLKKDAPKGPFVFFEGPPTANGKPGIHHAEARAFKDCIPRFRTMQGYRVIRKGGWDTHGLPVELEVEKELGFISKAQIEKYGIAAFNEKCKQNVWKYLQEWERFTERLGYWVDLKQAYVTYKPAYVESLWWVIKQIWDRGFLYKDYRVTPHCPRCGTSLSSHELSQGYQDVKDLSVIAKFPVVGEAHTFFLAWTTTPWTLPGNVGLAVGPEISYVKVHMGEEWLWLAKARLELLTQEYEVVEEVTGSTLIGKTYEPLYPFMKDQLKEQHDRAWTVLGAKFVTTEDGTGMVHTAVMYGQDDFELGHEVGLPKHHLVKLDGTFVSGTDFLAGRLVTDEQVAIDLIKDLSHRGLLFAKEKYEHSYPHCWRCKSKVIYYAKDSWYIAMSRLCEELLTQNQAIHWEPAHIKDGRFGEWLRDVKDWAFSRERYWGTPLPVWECQGCDHKMCIGSFAELGLNDQQAKTFDPHRPYVDDIILSCEKCGGQAQRVPDVCDVWFDSGAMPFAQWHYPFEHRDLIDSGEGYPADYICEAIDQTRGWFYTLLAVSTVLGKERSYKHVICLGHVLDAEGKKMSKSIGNVVSPMEMIDRYGADAVRWYMYTINQPGESKRFDEKILAEMVRKNFGILSNVVEFYTMFSSAHTTRAEKSLLSSPSHVLDRWILSRLHQLVGQTTDRLERYLVTETVRSLGEFITDLSTWYVRRSRDRFKVVDAKENLDTQAATATLQICLLTLSKLMAPFAPFLAEGVYRDVGGQKESVHLEDWPIADSSLIDEQVLSEMERTRLLVSLTLERRAEAKINVRQALSTLTVTLPSGTLAREYVEVLRDEVNVKSIEFKTGDLSVELDLMLTPELVQEGIVREIIRRVNALRKRAGLTIEDRIDLFVSGSDEVVLAIEEHKEVLLHGTLAQTLLRSALTLEYQETFSIAQTDVTIGFVLSHPTTKTLEVTR